MSDWSDNISASVRRVLDAALSAAAALGREPTAADILLALLEDEGHATEVLRGAGITATIPPADTSPVVSAARLTRIARQLTRGGDETTSLHLLAALCRESEAATAHLAMHGLAADQLVSPAGSSETEVPPPLPAGVSIAPAQPAVDDLAAPLRILDAAANRAREGLRVLEDHARFAANDPHLTSQLKDLRHCLAEFLVTLMGDRAIRYRDTPRDVGTGIHTRFESRRESDLDIVRANARRVQEALRTIEEYGKRLDAITAQRIGHLRYRAYTLEQALLTSPRARERLAGVRLCLLATDALCPRGVGPVVQAALAGGCPLVQLREKDVPAGQLLHRAKLIREWTRAAGALFIVNDRPDIAVLADADGVHVGQEDLSCAEARRIVGGDRLVGVSTHNVAQIRQAVLDGADYLGVGPVFSSQTKSFGALAGLEFVAAAAAETALPWFAIGGITVENVGEVVSAGARRVALTAAICSADDPKLATQAVLQRLPAIDSSPSDKTPLPAEGADP